MLHTYMRHPHALPRGPAEGKRRVSGIAILTGRSVTATRSRNYRRAIQGRLIFQAADAVSAALQARKTGPRLRTLGRKAGAAPTPVLPADGSDAPRWADAATVARLLRRARPRRQSQARVTDWRAYVCRQLPPLAISATPPRSPRCDHPPGRNLRSPDERPRSRHGTAGSTPAALELRVPPHSSTSWTPA